MLKELIENCIDALSTEIKIETLKGGLTLLKIKDNGSGISELDFPLLCERYATSKLRNVEDLLNLDSFGFRGEALAALSLISDLEVSSIKKGALCGFKGNFKQRYLFSILI